MHIWLPTIRTGTGTDRYTEKLAEALRRRGVGVAVAWFPLIEEVLPLRVRSARPPRATTHVHINTWMPAALPTGGFPLIVTAHTCSDLARFDRHKSPGQRLYHRIVIRPRIRSNLQRAAAGCAVGSHVCRRYAEAYGATLDYVPNWAAPEELQVFRPRSGPIRNLLFVGRPGWHKGSDLLPALARLLPSGLRLRCTLGTRQWQGSALPENVELLGRVDRERLIALLQDTDLLIAPSRHEGFSLALLEAMSMGLPALGFEGSGIDDLVRHGETGMLVPMENIAAMASAITDLAASPRACRRLGDAALALVRSEFSEDKAMNRLLRIYARCG